MTVIGAKYRDQHEKSEFTLTILASQATSLTDLPLEGRLDNTHFGATNRGLKKVPSIFSN